MLTRFISLGKASGESTVKSNTVIIKTVSKRHAARATGNPTESSIKKAASKATGLASYLIYSDDEGAHYTNVKPTFPVFTPGAQPGGYPGAPLILSQVTVTVKEPATTVQARKEAALESIKGHSIDHVRPSSTAVDVKKVTIATSEASSGTSSVTKDISKKAKLRSSVSKLLQSESAAGALISSAAATTEGTGVSILTTYGTAEPTSRGTENEHRKYVAPPGVIIQTIWGSADHQPAVPAPTALDTSFLKESAGSKTRSKKVSKVRVIHESGSSTKTATATVEPIEPTTCAHKSFRLRTKVYYGDVRFDNLTVQNPTDGE